MRRTKLLGGAVALATLLTVPGTAFAQGGPPPGRGGGSGETTTANNLSVPTIMITGGGFTGVACGTSATAPSKLVAPSGEPRNGYPIEPTSYYYVQGLNPWQAQCYSTASASVTADWGDNLTGEGKLSVGSPIRVELGLYNADTTSPAMDGYTVVKLDPNALDRESAYGTLATGSSATGFSATATSFSAAEQRVYAAGVTFSIQNTATGTYAVAPGTPATAEINATGNVVYGYNLRVSTPGTYAITFTFPSSVTFTATNSSTTSININVTSGRGGGGTHGRH